MGIFVKRIDEQAARAFFIMAYEKIFSRKEQERHGDQLSQIKSYYPLLAGVKQQEFDECLTAVNIAWLEIAWSKYCWEKHVDLRAAIDFRDRLRPEIEERIPELKRYKSLAEMYEQAFGSSYTDGNGVMATQFVMHIVSDFDRMAQQCPEEIRQIVLFFSSQFIGIFDSSMAGFKSRRVIS